MNKESNKVNQKDAQTNITSNAFLENVMPQIKVNQKSFPLNEFGSSPKEIREEVPSPEKK